MAACAFFSNMKNENANFDMAEAINITESIEEIFRSLIINRDVNIFYTPGETLFDLIGALIVFKLKKELEKKYYDIYLVKISGKDDFKKEISRAYDRCCYFKSNEYRDKCEFALKLGDFIVLDTLFQNDEKELLFPCKTLFASSKHDKVEITDVKLYTNF